MIVHGFHMNKQSIPNDFNLKKRKGQYILTDENVIARQIRYADIDKTNTVLEIGPGLGAITFPLAEGAGKVIAIEQDVQSYEYLKDRIPGNVELILGDALKLDLPKFDICVSNLPYGISSPITFRLLEHVFERAVLMYQQEFAERMVANPGETAYSRLSIMVYYRAKCGILERVPKKAFYPQPDVDSAIVGLAPRKPPFIVNNEDFFFRVVKELFSTRRKKIRNSISRLIEGELRRKGNFTASLQKKIIDSLPFGDSRVEMLTSEQLGQLSDTLYMLLEK
jgi:16S rRNA (adenine1518-N6/adenine1519-N6)-dimethyltransferase